MKRMTYFVMALALALGLAQCKKEQVNTPENETKTVNITLKVGGNGGSRHTIDTENGDVDFQDGDVIYVGDGSTYIGTLTRTGGVFSGPITEPADGSEIYFYFVGGLTPSSTPVAGTTPSFTVDISNQSTQMPVLSCNHVTYYSSTTSYSCTLQNQCALVQFTTASTTDPVHVGGLYTGATINFGTETPGITNNSTTGFVALNSESATEKWAVLLPQTGFNAEAAIAHVGYTATIPTIEADGFITGDAAISISTPNNIVYLDWITSGYTATNGQTLKGTLSGNYQISIDADATVTLRNANITSLTDADYAGITCDNDATIILEGTNTVVGGFYTTWTDFGDYPGIFIAEDHTLTIDGTGTLYAKCGALDEGYGEACGIGGGYDLHCGNINIQGGTIIATGGGFHAGIGGGDTEENDDAIRCGDITISGGTVTATGGENAAGIGSGNQGSCGDITISGGTVTAIGGENAAGIGSGSSGTCGDIKINDGTVTATGGADATGIGSGGSGSCGDISISGGTVTATGGANAAGIGSGYIGTCGDITITSGVTRVTATKGTGAPNSIGAGRNGYCGTVEIGGTVYWGLKDGSTDEYEYKNGGDTYLTQSPLVYPTPTPSAPTGAINGLFSVSATQQVWFSQGNLLDTGDFIDPQYDYYDLYEYDDGNDLLQWAASFTSNYSGDWRALTSEEWNYLLTDRANASNLWGFAYVAYSNGIILLPDGSSLSINTNHSDWDNNTIDATTWSEMEANGAVFLPAAGCVEGSEVEYSGEKGYYWCSTSGGYMRFGDSGNSFEAPTCYGGGSDPRSVRLVINAQ